MNRMRTALLGAIAWTALSAAGHGALAKGDTLVYAMYDDIKDWDPASSDSLEVIMLTNVYEPLVWYNRPGSKTTLSPGLATAWVGTDGGKTWTFTLRKGVTFHDGTPFNAAAAKASIERTKKIGKGSAFIWDQVAGIEAPSDDTLVIHCTTPQPVELIASAQYGAYIYSPAAAEKGGAWFNEGHDAGTGPYQVRQWDKGQQVVLERYDGYWGGVKGEQFKRVLLRVVGESATQVQMIRSGEADFVTQIPPEVIKSLKQDPNIVIDATPSWTNYSFLLNTAKPPTDNLKFRQALAAAFDYQSVVRDVLLGAATIAKGPIPASMWGHDASLPAPAFDLALARKLLDESGVPAGQRKVSLAYIAATSAYANAAQLWQANLAKIGIELELKPGPWNKIWDEAKHLESAPNIQSMAWWPSYATPSDWLIGLFRTESPTVFNLSHYSNPKLDGTINEAVSLEVSDRAKATELYKNAQKIVRDEVPAVFYADLSGRIIHRADIAGIEPNPAYSTVFFSKLSRRN